MTAKYPQRRTVPAKAIAQQYGVTTRAVRKFIAEPREEFLKRTAENRKKVIELRWQGLKLKDIAKQTGIPEGTVGKHISWARQNGYLPPKPI